MTFEEDLQAQGAKPTETADADVLINGRPYTLRFLQLAGHQWVAEGDKYPVRPEVAIDRRYGYNLRALCLAVAKMSGRRVDGDALQPLSEEAWDAIFRDLPGADVQRVCDAIWELNEFRPEEALKAAKKAAAALSEPSFDSPQNSESPSAD
jgi:hypothetical protein